MPRSGVSGALIVNRSTRGPAGILDPAPPSPAIGSARRRAGIIGCTTPIGSSVNAVLPERLAAFIAREGIDVEVLTTGEAAHTAEAAARILDLPVSGIVKTMVLTDGICTVAAIVPGDRRLDRRKVAAAVGAAALRFANAEEVVACTGYPPGGVAPFAFCSEVRVVIDESLAGDADRT